MKKLSILALLLICLSCIEDVPPVIADFSYTETGEGGYYFQNESTNATTYEWDFGTGDSSTEENPLIRFTANGTYTVTLTAKGEGGQNSKTKTIRVESVPTTGQALFYTNWSGAGYVDIYVFGEVKGVLTKYFTSGIPTCNTEGTVSVTLPGGTYNYTAISSNGSRWEGTFTVINGKCTPKGLTN